MVPEVLRHLESESLVANLPKGPIVSRLDLNEAKQIDQIRVAVGGRDCARSGTSGHRRGSGSVFQRDPRMLRFTAPPCAGHMMTLDLELGRNEAFIVFDDADLDAAVEGP